ncbi:MAG: fatty acid desaturase [Planctomycetes bacterium]|nr:fatty acid desaturase [Planctomycetota bacterium]
MRAGRILSRPEDAHCVIFHLACLLAYALAFWVWLNPAASGVVSMAERVAFVIGAAFLLGWISGVDVGVNFHNHTHRRIFTRPWLNRWFGRLWTFSGGWPAAYWQYAHVTVHHANLLGERDWTLPKRRPDGSVESIYRYVLLHWPWRYAVHLWRDVRAGHFERRRASRELLWFVALWSIPFWIDPWMGLWLWALPHWVGNAVTMGSGMYVQHAGCVPKDAQHRVEHSNGFLSRFFNRTMFNIGYHVEHHDHPGVHWADLPDFHAQHRERLVAEGAHYVPYGYYVAARKLAALGGGRAGMVVFRNDKAVGYRREAPAAPRRVAPRAESA